jgi:hypothetical protein
MTSASTHAAATLAQARQHVMRRRLCAMHCLARVTPRAVTSRMASSVCSGVASAHLRAANAKVRALEDAWCAPWKNVC